MEHRNRDQIRDVADILPSYLQARPLSKRERLELWIEALEREGGRRLRTLYEIEYARRASLPYYYLGYWVRGCRAMEYKKNFRPSEVLQTDGVWRRL